MLVDSHCHLDFPDFAEDLDQLVDRAHANDVGVMLTIGTLTGAFDKVAGIAERFEDIWCSVGVHPHEAATEPDVDAERLIELARHPKVVGIGETGLDYYYDNSPRARQRESFRVHIQAARKTGLPLIVHSRDADEDTASILEDEMTKGAFGGVIHCFTAEQGPRGASARAWLPHLVFGHRDLQERGRSTGGRENRAFGSTFGRDRCALSRAGAEPGQAERARVRAPHRGRRGRAQGRVPR